MNNDTAVAQPRDLPVGPLGRAGLGWFGVGTLVATEAALFSYLLFAYYYTGAAAAPGWLLEPHPVLKLALPNTILLLASSGAAWPVYSSNCAAASRCEPSSAARPAARDA